MASQTTKLRSWLVTAALVGGSAVGAAGIASAASHPATPTKGAKAPATAPQQHGAPPAGSRPALPDGMDPAKLDHGPGETLLTGSDLQSATDAALKAVPGATVIRAETDGQGEAKYEVHLTKADGSRLTVKLDASFAVTATEEGFGPGPHGPHGPQGPRGPHGPHGDHDGPPPAPGAPTPGA